MIPHSVELIDSIKITLDPINFTKEDETAIKNVFSNPSVVKYLNHLKSDLYRDHAQIDLKTYCENKDLFAMQQVFVKGGINVIETLLQIHKDQPK